MAHAWAHVSPTVCTYDTHTFTGDPGISWERFVPLGWHTLALIQAECMVAKGTMIVASGGKTYKCASQVTTTAVKVPLPPNALEHAGQLTIWSGPLAWLLSTLTLLSVMVLVLPALE